MRGIHDAAGHRRLALTAELANPPVCERCDGARLIVSAWSKRKIRCPMCTRRKVKKRAPSKSLGAEISTPEAIRMGRILANICAQIEINRWKFPGLPSHLVGTDRVMQRWVAAPSGMASDNPDVYAKARPPPLDDRTQEKVSDIVKAAPSGVRAFIWDWYKIGTPDSVMAEQRHMSIRQLKREWQDVLVFLRSQFAASEHADLTTLVRQLP